MSNIGGERQLFGRMFRVNECDADPEFAAKVARIQEDLATTSRSSSLSQEPEQNEAMVSFEESEDVTEKIDHEISETQESATGTSTLDDSVEPDGPCYSRPKKSKLKKIEPIPATINTKNSHDMLKISQSGEKSNNNNNKNDSELSDQEEPPPSSEEPVESFKGGYSSQETLAEDSGASPQEFDDSHDGVEYNTTIDRQSSKSVSGRIDLLEYSEREWNGKTFTAEHMKLGYFKIIEKTGYKAMRRIRGDNYCGLRATCFQVLSQNLNVLRDWDRIEDIEQIPQKLIDNHGCNWLAQWSFANRLQVSPKKKIDTMVQCLKCFNNQLEYCKSIEDDDSRIQHLLKYFNSGNYDEILLFEAIKLLMLYSAVLIHDCMKAGKEIPDYGMLLFARDTSETPEQLMKQHLNTVGDTGGLEQIEMMLLGYTLKVTIRVVRPSQAEQEDFMSYYPDNHKEDWDTCDLIAEDDRHYNIIVD